MYDPLADNTRTVNVPGTDTILQVMRKKDKTYILPLSKQELRGNPDSWKSPIITGTLLYSTLFIWAYFLAPLAFPLLLIASPVFILASVIGFKGLNNFLLSDPAQEEASPENERDFNSTSNLPEIVVEKNLLHSSEKEIIESYRENAFNKPLTEYNPYITDRSFSQLFNKVEKENDNEEKENPELNEVIYVEDTSTVERTTQRNN